MNLTSDSRISLEGYQNCQSYQTRQNGQSGQSCQSSQGHQKYGVAESQYFPSHLDCHTAAFNDVVPK